MNTLEMPKRVLQGLSKVVGVVLVGHKKRGTGRNGR